MYLKSLQLKGFKSFADNVELVFEEGLTAIVGSNGSGKSNISDAILWVLGEQSARSLRGQSMEDIIFAGSSARKAVSVAEVTLVLDNRDHTLAVDFGEVAITRRMYRSGESEYLINGVPARLMDIQDILHDSGLGKDTHSIISQGKLDEILSNRPEDRRALIEEAAGISKHKKRKERSLKKITQLDASLGRARDIERQLKRRLGPLEKQVNRAAQYEALTSELHELEIDLAVDELKLLKGKWDSITHREKECAAELDVAQFEQRQKADELERLQVMLEEKGLFVGDLAQQRRRMQSVMERLEAHMRLLEEKGRNMVDKLSQARATLHRSEQDLRQATEAHHEALEGKAQAQGRLDELAGELASQEQVHQALMQKRADRDQTLTAQQSKITSLRRDVDKDRIELSHLLMNLQDLEAHERMTSERLASLSEQVDQAKTNKELLAARLKDLEVSCKQATKDHQQSEKALEVAGHKLAEAQKFADDTQTALTRALARKDALDQMADELRQENEALALWHASQDEAARRAQQVTFLSGVSLLQEFEPLAESLLGERLQDYIAAQDLTVHELLKALMQVADKPGSVGVWSQACFALDESELNRVCEDARVIEAAGYGKTLLGTMSFEGKAQAQVKLVAQALLGDVVVVHDPAALSEIIALAKQQKLKPLRLALDDGAIVSTTGYVTVGKTQQSQRSSGALARHRERGEVESQIMTLKAQLAQALQAKQAAQDDQDELRRARDELSRVIHDLEYRIKATHRESGEIDATLSRLTSEHETVHRDQQDRTQKALEMRPRADALRATIDEKSAVLVQLEDELATASRERDEALELERAQSNSLVSLRVEVAALKEQIKHLDQRAAQHGASVAKAQDAIEHAGVLSKRLEVATLRVQPLHEMLKSFYDYAEVWAVKLRDQASLEQTGSESLKASVEAARQALDQARRKTGQAREALNEIKVDKGRLDVQVDQAIKAIAATGAVLEQALERPALEDRIKAQTRKDKLVRDIQNLGPVNMVALEEYHEVKREHEHIASQVADLEQARKTITKIIAAIDRKMKDRFLQTFEIVNEHYQEVFASLFPGGVARLEMTDPDDPAETGIEVIAQPKGKRLSKMTLMSGGEKSLTALALLFAVYRTRTVPFYVLDEVEAALDDANLNRLLHAVDVLREKTQLIIITHQRRTMEQADVLYGVSMQADGVSKVVSQRLNHDVIPQG